MKNLGQSREHQTLLIQQLCDHLKSLWTELSFLFQILL